MILKTIKYFKDNFSWKHFFKALLVSYIVIIVSFILFVVLIEHPNDSFALDYLLWSIKYFPYYYYNHASDIGVMPLYYTLQLVAFVVSLLAYSLIHKRLIFLLVLLISLSFSPYVDVCLQVYLGYAF